MTHPVFFSLMWATDVTVNHAQATPTHPVWLYSWGETYNLSCLFLMQPESNLPSLSRIKFFAEITDQLCLFWQLFECLPAANVGPSRLAPVVCKRIANMRMGKVFLICLRDRLGVSSIIMRIVPVPKGAEPLSTLQIPDLDRFRTQY